MVHPTQRGVDAAAHEPGVLEFVAGERAQEHFYSDSLLEETAVWFHLKGTQFDWKKLEDMAGLRIGAVRGYTYTKRFYELIEQGVLQVEFVADDEQNYRKLMLGRIDVVPEVGLLVPCMWVVSPVDTKFHCRAVACT